MPDATRRPQWLDDEPSPQFATAADIALADALRRQLERRYFGEGRDNPPVPPAANEERQA